MGMITIPNSAKRLRREGTSIMILISIFCGLECILQALNYDVEDFIDLHKLSFLFEASFGLRVLSLPASVCVCVR